MRITEVSKGIPHIEDLDLSDFIDTLDKWHFHEATEKLDGAQILFGIDENGFYTSRESKGGRRIYNESDYDVRFSTTYMRATHKLLESVLPALKSAGLRLGDQVESEVLSGPVPNVVQYSEDTNYLIFLRVIEGNVNINRLKQKLAGHSLSITLDTPITVDGRKIYVTEQTHEWKFSRSPIVPMNRYLPRMFNAEKKALKEYANTEVLVNGCTFITNADIMNIPLNRRPDWCEPKDWKIVKEELKALKESIAFQLIEYKLAIKTILLDHFVRQQASAFGPSLEDGGWIEGVVLRRTDTGKMVKLVDKDTFTMTLREAWFERNALMEGAKSIDGNHSFLGTMFVSMASALGHPELGTLQAKNYLRKASMITEDRITTLSNGVDFESVKSYWINLLEKQKLNLETRLVKYEKEKDIQKSTDDTYRCSTQYRTLEAYSTIFKKIISLQEATILSVSVEDLITILIGKLT